MTERTELPSIWTRDVDLRSPPRLTEDLQVDVCIIGAGIAGLTTAKLLSSDRSVVVLDARGPGAGETGRTTAHLTHALDDRYARIIELHGEERARLAAESHTRAIERVEAFARAFDEDCDFEWVDGFLFAPPGSDGSHLEEELEAAHRAGLSEVGWAERAPIAPFETGRCLRYPRQAQIHPLKYVAGLVSSLEKAGVRLYGDTRVVNVEGGDPPTVRTQSGAVVTADAVIVATNTPMNERVMMHTKQGAYRTYALAASIAANAVERALYWDTAQRAEDEGEQGAPYHYVRLASTSAGEVLIVGGEDHKTGQAHDESDRFGRLEAWTRGRFPAMEDVVARWSGQVLEPVDSLQFIGPDPTGQKNVFLVTGDSGNGMTGGTAAGMLLADLVRGVENPWARVYDPARITVRSLPRFAKENLDAATHLVGDRVKPSEVSSLDAIEPGHGALVRHGLDKVAVYRDELGDFHARSAVCTHLGCLVQWNRSARTWDCPCHGSRFSPRGEVVNGPAVEDLGPAEIPKSPQRVERG